METTRTLADLGRADIDRAICQLSGRIWRTPVVRSDGLDELAGARLWLKAENLQRGGSFKVRGAVLAVGRLAAGGSRGIVAQSTGNHAVAVALAAREVGLPAVLVLPTDAPAVKVAHIRRAGAEVVLAGTGLADRVAAVRELRDRRGYDLVDPYQDPDVVTGQGTATAELLDQVAGLGARLDTVVVPIGGGSAIAGACLAAEGLDIEIVGAEPAAVPAFTAAVAAGRPVTVAARPTIADGLRPERIGDLPFAIARDRVTRVVTVAEDRIVAALRAALLHARLVVEPAAATALAAVLDGVTGSGGDIGVLLSGGNVEPALLDLALAQRTD